MPLHRPKPCHATLFVLVVEGFNRRRGPGSRRGTWGEGCGGLREPCPNQGLDPVGIISQVPVPRG